MSADMKTLRDALDHLGDATDNGAGGGAANLRAAQALDAALDELEALRAQHAYAESLDTENQRLRAEKAEAQRNELLAALEALRVENAEVRAKAELRRVELLAAEATQARVLLAADAKLAKAEAQRDELLAALRRLYDEGEGCAACGKATRPGCGCRYEQAAQALAKAGDQ